MSSKKLPKITEFQIKKLATSKSFERGEDYFQDGSIMDAVIQGMKLRAMCEGSDYEPYQITVTLNDNGIEDYDCSCPYDYGGICKHIVALLLEYIHNRKDFRVVEPVDKTLADRSKEELISIINEMIEREPKFSSIVEVTAATQKARQNKTVDVNVYRRQAKSVMRSESSYYIERELKALCETAKGFAKSGDYLNAGAIYHASFEEAVDGYDDIMWQIDEEGDIAVIIDDLAKGLIECLKKSSADNKTRMTWLNALLDGYLKDLEMGGVDFVSSADDALLRVANDDEWAEIEKRIRGLIPSSRDWKRENLIEFLTQRMKAHKRKDDAKALIRELGTDEQNAYLLIEEKKIDEALKLIRQILVTKPGLLNKFADALLEVKANDKALELVMKQPKQGWQEKEWLANYFRKHGSKQEAVEYQKSYFLNSPSVEKFKTLNELGNNAGNWNHIRSEVLKHLEIQKQFSELIEIALHEKDVKRALELLPKATMGWRAYDMEVAKAAEKDFPKEAIALYQNRAEKFIGEKNRNAYSSAAAILKQAKKLYEKTNAKTEWVEYIKTLRAKYANLPALQDELNKALSK